MSFTVITPGEIASGEPVNATTMGKVKDNFDDHESRLQVIESGTATTYPPLIFRVGGSIWIQGALDGIIKTTTNFPIQITGARLISDVAGSSGTTEIDIKWKRGSAGWVSIFSTKPSLSYSAGNDATSSNAVLNASNVELLAGDLIRLDLTSVQTDAYGFTVRVDYVGN